MKLFIICYMRKEMLVSEKIISDKMFMEEKGLPKLQRYNFIPFGYAKRYLLFLKVNWTFISILS